LIPQAKRFQKYWKRAGVNIDDYTIPLERARHRFKPNGIHMTQGGDWNRVWDEFFKINPHAMKQEILDQLAKMRRDFNI
jgi:hypothetical protein